MDIAEQYIRLAHGLAVYSEGYIDGYYGPKEWADKTKYSPEQLKVKAGDLLAKVTDEPNDQRRQWLISQVKSMHMMTRLLCHEELSYRAEVIGLYAIEPLRSDLSTLEKARHKLEGLVPGQGNLAERIEAIRQKVNVPKEKLMNVIQPILDELKQRTAHKFGLPVGEDFTIALVSDKPWSGYNWPLGNLKSRIDINTDLPTSLVSLPDLLAHEGYPGHHTEHTNKEALLVRERHWKEHSIQLINTPECVISEGIATCALQMVMTADEVTDWLTGDLAQIAGLDPDDLKLVLEISKASQDIKNVSGTAALMLHEDHQDEEEVLHFIQHYSLVNEQRARHSLRFMKNPTFRAYIFTYSVGKSLVADYIGQYGDQGFQRLLSEPVTTHEIEEG